MRRSIMFTALTSALAIACHQFIRAAEPPSAARARTPIEAKLRVDRRQYHPGELIELQGFLTNPGSKEFRLPGVDFARQFAFVHLHIARPQGEEFVYDPYADHPLRSSLVAISPKSFVTTVLPTEKQSAFQKYLRFTDGLTLWSSSDHPRGPLSLRAPGDYRIWFEYRVPAIADAPQDAWVGTAKSDTVVVTVAELPAPKRGDKPTKEQLAAIDKLQSVAPTSIEGREVLQQAMLRAENEPLAEHLVDLCLQDARRQEDYIAMISWRACTPDPERGIDGLLQLGIDGPYLKTAALAAIDAYEHPPKAPNHHRMFRSTYGVNTAIAYLRFHPEDQLARGRLVKIAKESAPLPPKQTQTAKGLELLTPRQQTGPAPLQNVAAWRVLIELGVLHTDMTVSEAIEILGPPSRRSDQSLTWYIDTPRHVNPGLTAILKAGRITVFQQFSG